MGFDIVKIKRVEFHNALHTAQHDDGVKWTSKQIINNMGIEQVSNGEPDIYAFKVIDKKKWVVARLQYGI